MTPQERRRRLEALEARLGVGRAPRFVLGFAEVTEDGNEVVAWPDGQPATGDQALIVEFVATGAEGPSWADAAP